MILIHFTHVTFRSTLSVKGGVIMTKINRKNTADVLFRISKLLGSFLIISFGIIFMLNAGIGMNAWSTLAMGVSKSFHISFGQANQIIGLAILLVMGVFKIYPGIGTILDLTLIGFMVHIIEQLHVVSTPNELSMQLLMCFTGLLLFCYGLLIYYRCGLGIGPRESIVIALVKKTNKGFSAVKTTIESSVFIFGILLGGDFGIGTILITIFTGRIMETIFTLHNYDIKNAEHLDLRRTLDYIRA